MADPAFALDALIGYLLGALPFGYLVARAYGVDIFKAGSGNPGATNVKRVLGARAGNTVFALDAAKGAAAAAIPLLLAYFWTRGNPILANWHDFEREDFWRETWAHAQLEALVSVVAAVLGHSFSVFTKFKGGKGVATAAGGLLVLMPLACLIGAAVWAVTFFTTRYVSLGSILAAVVVPASSWMLGYPLPLAIVATALGLFVIIRHRANISRLLAGTESRFGRRDPRPETRD